MDKDEHFDFHELAKTFKNPAVNKPEPEYLISSEETPFIRRFEEQNIHNLLDGQVQKLVEWRDGYLKLIKSIGCKSKMDEFNVKSLTKLANYLYFIGNIESSQYILDLILKEYPEDTRSLHNKGLCIAKQGDIKGALKLINLTIDQYPDYYDALFNKASFLSQEGRYSEGISILESLLPKFPFHEGRILESLVNSYAHLSDLKKAKEYYEKAKDKNIDTILLKLNLALAYYNNKNFSESLNIYEEVLKKEPKNYQANINRISCLIELKLPYTALTSLLRLKKVFPRNPDIFQHLAMVNVLLNRPSYAIVLAEKAICLGANDYLIYNYLGLAYTSLGDYEEGIKNYDDAISLNKECYHALGNMSNNLLLLKRLKESVEVMRLFLEIRPNEEIILNNMNSVQNEILRREEWPEEFRDNHF